MGSGRRFEAWEKREALRIVAVAQARTGWTIRRILKGLRFPKSLYYEWTKREGEDRLADLFRGARSSPYAVLDEEKQAVIRYAPRLASFERNEPRDQHAQP